jgi:hypothetical protein
MDITKQYKQTTKKQEDSRKKLKKNMDATTLNTTVTLIGIVIGCITISTIYIEKRRHRLNLSESIFATIKSIKKGRNCKVAVLEDFPVHKKLSMALMPYLVFKKKSFARIFSEYEGWHETIKDASKRNQLAPFGADWQEEIDFTMDCLNKIKHHVD